MPVLFKKSNPSQIILIKSAKKSFFIIEKIEKYRKCRALQALSSYYSLYKHMNLHIKCRKVTNGKGQIKCMCPPPKREYIRHGGFGTQIANDSAGVAAPQLGEPTETGTSIKL